MYVYCMYMYVYIYIYTVEIIYRTGIEDKVMGSKLVAT